ncbi:MAG: dihydroorotase [Cytophagales bacterium]|nr:dihydroorotase [Bernardetiaceae bacterium]MDW8204722.1 dihydroorotase [Cytophagales bacterium]
MKKILFNNITIIDENSPFHRQKTDVLIVGGKIAAIGENANQAEDTIRVVAEGLMLSPGWVDMRSLCGQPGYEHRETLQSLSAAAAAGGFTDVALMPNTSPPIQTADAVAAVKHFRSSFPVALHPIAAASADIKGEDMSELLDLHHAGAIAFSDGTQTIYKTSLIIKILLYLKQFDGLFINVPNEKSLAQYGQMHEGVQSTLLGLRGIPSLAEEMGIRQHLQLLTYTGGKLHFSCISSAAGVELIRCAKAEGFAVTADVASYHLACTDEDLDGFDTNLKVMPPLRTAADQQALLAGIADGTIDALVSNHIPLDPEAKLLEFDLAEFGMINLQTHFAIVNSFGNCSPEKIVQLLATQPRHILGLPPISIHPNSPAHLTVFHPSETWEFTPNTNLSLSANSPFFGRQFTGRVYGTLRDGKIYWQPTLTLSRLLRSGE